MAYQAGELNRDVVAVVRFQGPSANGMPELHSLSPILGALQDKGFKVALVTDGRMSGASGKVPSAIHISPEAAKGGALAQVRDGDLLTVNCDAGRLEIDISEIDLAERPLATFRSNEAQSGLGRDLFTAFRSGVSDADTGASLFNLLQSGAIL